MNNTKLIGITGNIGSGKSVVANYLKSKSYFVLDADEIVSKIYDSSRYQKIKEKIKQILPECVKKGRLIKKCIKNIIFNNKEKKEQLESIIHPIVIDEIIKTQKKIKQNPKYNKSFAFFVVPLLYEKKLEYLFDEVWMIFAPTNICIKRIIKRDKINEDLVKKIMENQMNPLEKVKKADKVIINDKDIESLYNQLDKLVP